MWTGWWAAVAVAVVGCVLGILVAAPVDAKTFWFAALVFTWTAATLWGLTRRDPPLAFLALQVLYLFNVIAGATVAFVDGEVTLGVFDFSEGMVGALRLSTAAQAALWAGVVASRSVTGHAGRTRPVRVPPRRRLDRLALGLLLAGVVFQTVYVVLAGVDLATVNVVFGESRRGELAQLAEGPVVKYFKSLGSLAGVAMVVVAYRVALWGWRRSAVPWLVLAMGSATLVMEGTRTRLMVPVVAAGFVWWKTAGGMLSRRPRTLLVAGAAFAFAFLATIGGLRGQQSGKVIDIPSFLDRQVRDGVFSATAGLVWNVPSRVDHLYGRSYLDLVTLPVPRALWAQKPEGTIKQLQSNWLDPRMGASFATWGEMYANFGVVGVLVGMVLFGALVQFCWSRFAQTASGARALVLAAVIVVLLEVSGRGHLAGQVAGHFGFLVGSLAAAWRVSRYEESSVPATVGT